VKAAFPTNLSVGVLVFSWTHPPPCLCLCYCFSRGGRRPLRSSRRRRSSGEPLTLRPPPSQPRRRGASYAQACASWDVPQRPPVPNRAAVTVAPRGIDIHRTPHLQHRRFTTLAATSSPGPHPSYSGPDSSR
jgi:hypothetical protein